MVRLRRLLLTIAFAFALVWWWARTPDSHDGFESSRAARRESEVTSPREDANDVTGAERVATRDPAPSDDGGKGAPPHARKPESVDSRLHFVDARDRRELDSIEIRRESAAEDGRPYRVGVGAEDVLLTRVRSPVELDRIPEDLRDGMLWVGAAGCAWTHVPPDSASASGWPIALKPGFDLTLVLDHFVLRRDDAVARHDEASTRMEDASRERMRRMLRPRVRLLPKARVPGESITLVADAPVIQLAGLPAPEYDVLASVGGDFLGSGLLARGNVSFDASRSATLTLDIGHDRYPDADDGSFVADVTVHAVDASTQSEVALTDLLWSRPDRTAQTLVTRAGEEPIHFVSTARRIHLSFDVPPVTIEGASDRILYRPHDDDHELAAGKSELAISLVRRNALLLKLASASKPDQPLLLHGAVEPASWIRSQRGDPFTLEAALLALGGVLFDVDPPGWYVIDVPGPRGERRDPEQVEIRSGRVVEKWVVVERGE